MSRVAGRLQVLWGILSNEIDLIRNQSLELQNLEESKRIIVIPVEPHLRHHAIALINILANIRDFSNVLLSRKTGDPKLLFGRKLNELETPQTVLFETWPETSSVRDKLLKRPNSILVLLFGMDTERTLVNTFLTAAEAFPHIACSLLEVVNPPPGHVNQGKKSRGEGISTYRIRPPIEWRVCDFHKRELEEHRFVDWLMAQLTGSSPRPVSEVSTVNVPPRRTTPIMREAPEPIRRRWTSEEATQANRKASDLSNSKLDTTPGDGDGTYQEYSSDDDAFQQRGRNRRRRSYLVPCPTPGPIYEQILPDQNRLEILCSIQHQMNSAAFERYHEQGRRRRRSRRRNQQQVPSAGPMAGLRYSNTDVPIYDEYAQGFGTPQERTSPELPPDWAQNEETMKSTRHHNFWDYWRRTLRRR